MIIETYMCESDDLSEAIHCLTIEDSGAVTRHISDEQLKGYEQRMKENIKKVLRYEAF